VRTLQDIGVRRDRQPLVDHPLRLGGVDLQQRPVRGHVRVVQVVSRHLVLGRPEHLPVGDPVGVDDVLEVPDALQRHEDAFHAVGQLDRHRVQVHPAGLLEVGELGDLQPVQPHLPAQSPGAERGGGPVVLDEPHVVRPDVDAERFEAAEVLLLRVAGLGLEDHLVLGVGLDPVRVLPVPGVVRPYRRLRVRHPPRLRPEYPKERGRIQGARADLGVHRLYPEAAASRPVPVEPGERLLHRQHRRSLRGATVPALACKL
jgi:hypothetical protein